MKTEISRADILDLASYEKVRAEKRDAARMAKADRRAEVGPFATLNFENYDTIWLQIQEMLRIEKGGDGQLADELAAYNPLIPKGRDLAATLMLEIPDPARRDSELRKLGGVEDTITLGQQVRVDLTVADEFGNTIMTSWQKRNESRQPVEREFEQMAGP